jgi:hypothetical protein
MVCFPKIFYLWAIKFQEKFFIVVMEENKKPSIARLQAR